MDFKFQICTRSKLLVIKEINRLLMTNLIKVLNIALNFLQQYCLIGNNF